MIFVNYIVEKNKMKIGFLIQSPSLYWSRKYNDYLIFCLLKGDLEPYSLANLFLFLPSLTSSYVINCSLGSMTQN